VQKFLPQCKSFYSSTKVYTQYKRFNRGTKLKNSFVCNIQHCGCPLRAGEARLQNLKWKLPELGGVKAIVVGDYEGQATFYGKSRPDIILGCVNMKFSVA
jgi:hypothetical protein